MGAFKNCFGDANAFVRRSALAAVGGYTEDAGVGFEDWELYATAALQGLHVAIVPEARPAGCVAAPRACCFAGRGSGASGRSHLIPSRQPCS